MVKWNAAVEHYFNLCKSETKPQAATLWYLSACSISVFLLEKHFLASSITRKHHILIYKKKYKKIIYKNLF